MSTQTPNNNYTPPIVSNDSLFYLTLAVALFAGILIRIAYFANFPSEIASYISGDGMNYHLLSHRLADGLGFTFPMWDLNSQYAHAPPSWVSVLGALSAMGFRSVYAHQLAGAFFGILSVVTIAYLARYLFGNLSGALAAMLAALYPGFWVIEPQILSEPLTIFITALLILVLYRFLRSATIGLALGTGVLLGLLALTRSEQFMIFALVTGILLLFLQGVTFRTRFLYGVIITVCIVLLVSPWAIYNSKRFEKTVITSTNMGPTLLVGNCPSALRGEFRGFWHVGCMIQHGKALQAAGDRSVQNGKAMRIALFHISNNLDTMPGTILARYGRALGIYKPAHTIKHVAEWHGTATWPVTLWIVSFLCILPFSIIGLIGAYRSGVKLYPLLAPIAGTVAVITVFYGEPRYHLVADLSFLVLAGHGLAILYNKFGSNKGLL